MIKAERIIKAVSIVIFLLAIAVYGSISTVHAKEKPDYKGMVDEIRVFLNEAISQYKNGNIQAAKSKAQAAYFEVFENMEGPIRINISAKKNIELEEEFTGIRNMIKDGKPVKDIEKRINALISELNSVAAELEGGVELVAEPSSSGGEKKEMGHAAVSTEKGAVHPVWQKAAGEIQTNLTNALNAYRKGDPSGAKEFVKKAQFDGFKNSLLETAVRQNISREKDAEHNAAFSELLKMISDKKDAAVIQTFITGMMDGINKDLPGLPLIEGAVSEREAQKLAQKEQADKNWAEVKARLFSEIDKAISLYEKGSGKEAAGLVQDAYFDIFEKSGMEAKIGTMDAGFKAKLESHFGRIVGQMKKGASLEDIRETLKGMNADFESAVAMLGKSNDSPAALFLYSLMIILREGFEAILIITAIIAYLIKMNHKDKLGVIYNGCVTAVVLSVITAVLVKWVFKTSAANQEIFEGAAMLLAMIVLFFVSYWLISKAEAQKWTDYIQDKVSDSLSSGSVKALWFTAFLAVYREGAETVLFYQALGANADSVGLMAISGGFSAGCVLLAAIYLIMRFGAVKLPIRPFFIFTGMLLYYMAFVFAGKGMMELIEGKLFMPSLIAWMPTIPFIGIFPYWQTLIPQILLLLAALFGLAAVIRKRKGISEEPGEQDK